MIRSFVLSVRSCDSQVSDTIKSDMATWFAGIGLTKNGVLNEPSEIQKGCTLTANTHGKAFELVATAAYHALFEFGGKAGVNNSEQYKILFSDPRGGDDKRYVALMKRRAGSRVRADHYEGSPYQRKPDLILEGEGEGKRQ